MQLLGQANFVSFLSEREAGILISFFLIPAIMHSDLN